MQSRNLRALPNIGRAPSRLTATVTATSANSWRCGWAVGAFCVGAECVVEGVDGLALEAEPYVGIDAGGDADVCVAEQLFDHDKVDALFEEKGGRQMP